MSTNGTSSKSYIEQPCDRCGSPKVVSETWDQAHETISGTSTLKVSQITCTNEACQAGFDKNRAEEVMRINEKKMKKEEQDKIRKDNIAQTIRERKESKLLTN